MDIRQCISQVAYFNDKMLVFAKKDSSIVQDTHRQCTRFDFGVEDRQRFSVRGRLSPQPHLAAQGDRQCHPKTPLMGDGTSVDCATPSGIEGQAGAWIRDSNSRRLRLLNHLNHFSQLSIGLLEPIGTPDSVNLPASALKHRLSQSIPITSAATGVICGTITLNAE